MRFYIGFDDTDILGANVGTGKLVRRFEQVLPSDCRVWGVVRQQLLVDPAIPYTSHNSSACVVIDCSNETDEELLLKLAVRHLEKGAIPGSDPGLCLIRADHPALSALQAFGLECTRRIVTQKEAFDAVGSGHLSGHGGTNDGLIGAAAAVGLTASGWHGRFIEFSGLRDFPDSIKVLDLWKTGIGVVSMDRDACVPGPEDSVQTKSWLRPRLWGHEAVLPVVPAGPGRWESLGGKRKANKDSKED